MARRTRQLIFWIVGGLLSLVLLAVLGLAVLLWGIDPDVFRTPLERAASQALGRRVELSGELRWRPGRNFQIESRGGSIANPAGFDGAAFASWQTIQFGVALRPLLQRRLVVDRIEMRGLNLNLVRNARGVNWTLAPQAPQQPAQQLQLAIGRIALRDSRVVFADEVAGRVWSATDIDLDVRLPENLGAPTLSFDQLSLRARFMGAPLVASGVTVAVRATRIDLIPAADRLQVPVWQLQWDEARIKGSLDASLGATFKLNGELNLQVPSLRKLLQSVSMPAPATRDAAVLGPLEFSTGFEFGDGAVALTGIDAKLDDTHFTGNLSAPTLSPLSLGFELNADELKLDRYRAPENVPSEPFELSLAALKSVDAKGTLNIRRAVLAGAVARELRIDVD